MHSDDPTAASPSGTGGLPGHIEQNIESVVAMQRRQWESTTPVQRRIQAISRFIGRPLYLVSLISIGAIWVAVNSVAGYFGMVPFDPPPFNLLDSIMSVLALGTTTIVLIDQSRQSRLEQQHTHLALQVNLLTEQKVTKLIHLIEELRQDLPMVRDRDDPHAAALKTHADTAQVITAIEQRGLADDQTTDAPAADETARDPAA